MNPDYCKSALKDETGITVKPVLFVKDTSVEINWETFKVLKEMKPIPASRLLRDFMGITTQEAIFVHKHIKSFEV